MTPDVLTALTMVLAGFVPFAVAGLLLMRRTGRAGGTATRDSAKAAEPLPSEPRAAVRCARCNQLVTYDHHPEGRADALRLHHYECGSDGSAKTV
jgi:hypothetical protein